MFDSETSSVNLSLFKEKICPSERPPLDVCAYRMDGNAENNIENMAKYAGLGTPSCCDYLYIDEENQKAILIEDTLLEKQIQKLKLELVDFDRVRQEKEFFRVKELLRQENCLKVYGALLILCRLMKRYPGISKELNGKEFSFYLVINDQDNIPAIDSTEIIPFLRENFKTALEGTLQGAKLVKKTKVLLLNQLKEELQPQ